jgi:ring-1,2-phenylacetyl-CoA epoxidase subunit PaaE
LIQHYLSGDGERLDKERVKSLVHKSSTGHSDYYVCGPIGMMKAVLSALQESASEEAKVYTEYFKNPDAGETATEIIKVNMSGDMNKVVVRLDEEDHQIELEGGESILEGAERIGIDPPFSCHSGVCTTCKAKLISGKVRMENNFGLGQDEIDEGFVLTCIGYPEEPGTKIDWDQA